jgi:putative NADH-flavin reductase
MKITLIGATGYVGSKLLPEALERGHDVTAVVRDPSKLPTHARLQGIGGNATDADALASIVAGHDLVISAFNPGLDPDGTGTRTLVSGVKRAGIGRFLAVGGAGTLKLPSGERVVDQPDFPAAWKDGALRTAAFLNQLLEERDLDWVFVSPATMLIPGERTGHYRLGKDHLLMDDKGESRISLQDFAVAMLDEAETPRHHRERFTVAY